MFIKLETLDDAPIHYNINHIQSIEKCKVSGRPVTKLMIDGDPKLVKETPGEILLEVKRLTLQRV